jgi:SAM-dependent methyltransferase
MEPSERNTALDVSSISPFVRTSLGRIALPRNALVLDMPCGFGRHAIWLAQQGYRVIAADLDEERVEATRLTHSTQSHPAPLNCVIADCEGDFPFFGSIFDAIFIVHYYSDQVVGRASRSLKPNGFLIFETFGAQGENWQNLPKLGTVARMLKPDFEPIYLHERPCGPNGDRAAVRSLAKKLQ